MGLLQKAVETYDCHREYVGKVVAEGVPLAPIAHTIRDSEIEICIDNFGVFVSALRDARKVIIPVTEASEGRSSTGAADLPHPLSDKLSYYIVTPARYTEQLEAWVNSDYSHPKLYAILKYLQRESILQDLERAGCLKRDKKGKLKVDDMIRWRVIGLEDNEKTACWEDQTLFNAYTSYYLSIRSGPQELCMVSGDFTSSTEKHPGLFFGKTKLISTNESGAIVYSGRFSSAQQACTVGYISSQKAHNALKWLVSRNGVVFGKENVVVGKEKKRVFLTWNPQGHQVRSVVGPFCEHVKARTEPADYQKDLWETLMGYKMNLPDNAGVVIAAFDAATKGRLSLTYYNELQGSDFLRRLYDWDLACCWNNGSYGIQSPTLFQIVKCAYGTRRVEKNQPKLVPDDHILKHQIQRLIACRVDRARIPTALVKALVQRASSPQAYDLKIWREIIFTACAVMNKLEAERKGVDTMAWTLETMDRSFQFGRLLAAMERVEQDYYRKTGEERQTSAIKALSEYRQRPWNTYERLIRHLNQAYLPRVEPWQRNRFIKLKDEIITIISQFPNNELNRPLDDIYLMGYDLQHAGFYKSNKDRLENKEVYE